jgi:Poly(R)-hydroxyalkanoic acid synthase subunit (PHA_synth_III_E).
MDWTQQANDAMKTWTDAQKQLWSGWMQWAQSGAGLGQPAAMFDPTSFLRMAVDTWSGAKDSPAQRLAGNVFGTPDMMMRSMNLIMKAWQMAAPQIEAGKPWQPDLSKLLASWKEETAEFPKRAMAATNEFAQLTKAMFERWSPMTAPWLSMLNQATASGHPGEAFMAGTGGLGRLLGMGEAFQMMSGWSEFGVSEMPRATVVREKMGKILRVVDAMKDLQEAQRSYQKTLGDGIAKSVERTIDHLAKLAEKGEKITSPRDLMRTFFSIADKTLMESFHTPEFLDIQDKLTAALMNHKIAQREALEIVYNSLEIPTRSEIDEAYRDIHELKKEVRALRKALKEAAPKVVLPRAGRKTAVKDVEATETSAS